MIYLSPGPNLTYTPSSTHLLSPHTQIILSHRSTPPRYPLPNKLSFADTSYLLTRSLIDNGSIDTIVCLLSEISISRRPGYGRLINDSLAIVANCASHTRQAEQMVRTSLAQLTDLCRLNA